MITDTLLRLKISFDNVNGGDNLITVLGNKYNTDIS